MGVNNSSTKQITAHPSLIRPAAGQCNRDAGNAASYNHHSQVRYAITQPLLPSASVWAKGLVPCHLFFSVHCDSLLLIQRFYIHATLLRLCDIGSRHARRRSRIVDGRGGSPC